WGGDLMEAQGGVLVKHIRELAYMGFYEVLANLPGIIQNFRLCKKDILEWKPDVLVLVDYPGFNLRMAAFARKHGIRTVYYISPQIWAWKQSRVKKIRRDVDKMLVILPFEKDFYSRFGVDVSFVGHPLLDALEEVERRNDSHHFRTRHQLPASPLVAILPGSRKQEVTRLLGEMAAVAGDFPGHHFVVAGMSSVPRSAYDGVDAPENVSVVFDQTYALLANAEAAMVASGTATLETALFQVPLVVCYKANRVSFWIARRLVKVKYISLVNLIMDRPLVKELIQSAFHKKGVSDELALLLGDSSRRNHILSGYEELRMRLGGPGASHRAARAIAGLAGGASGE
ncbi:MAG: lipid-A-disaccharide synthase, partial [Bacteroidales bacterium]